MVNFLPALLHIEESYTRVNTAAQMGDLVTAAGWKAAFGMANEPDHAHLYNLETLLQTTVVGSGDMTADAACVLGAGGGVFGVPGVRVDGITNFIGGTDGLYEPGNESFVFVVLFHYPKPWGHSRGIAGNLKYTGVYQGIEVVSDLSEGALVGFTGDGTTLRNSPVNFRHNIPNEPVVAMLIGNQDAPLTQLITNLGDGTPNADAHIATLATSLVSRMGAAAFNHEDPGATFIGSAIWLGANAEEVTERSHIDSFLDYMGLGWKHDREDL